METLRFVIHTDRVFRRTIIRDLQNYGWANDYPVRVTEDRRIWNTTLRIEVEVPRYEVEEVQPELVGYLAELERF